MSTVSIIIPCYKEGALLLAAVHSAVGQTHPDIEVLVVADGVEDPGTLDILRQIVTLDGVAVLHQCNGGVSSARNEGIRHATGEFLIFLDADDLLAPDFASLGSQWLAEHPQVRVFGGETIMFGDLEGPYGPRFNLGQLFNQSLLQVGQMVRRADAEAVGGFDENLRRYEDQDFFLKILALSDDPHRAVHQIARPLYYYRKHAASETAGGDDDLEIRSQARVFRNNVALFERHAEDFVSWRIMKMSYLDHLRHRYGWVERRLSRIGRLRHRMASVAGRIGTPGRTGTGNG
ncbi:glycosyltransferase [Micrococcus porci]|uniref:glycosyltransferase family 2 protein n=1 Tax=Micrococcus porci TaxID=2856555 RepID=UPI001CCB64C9|nr:glycosyltransferase [Micrococcus porci]UBH24488.1 glycosyltransferase [Micrococcus porci]